MMNRVLYKLNFALQVSSKFLFQKKWNFSTLVAFQVRLLSKETTGTLPAGLRGVPYNLLVEAAILKQVFTSCFGLHKSICTVPGYCTVVLLYNSIQARVVLKTGVLAIFAFFAL